MLARAPENFQTISQLVTESIVLVRKEPALNKVLVFFSTNRCTDFSKNPNFKKNKKIKKLLAKPSQNKNNEYTTGKTFTTGSEKVKF